MLKGDFLMRHICAFLLSCALSMTTFIHANSPAWSLEDVTSGWNNDSLVKMYFHNSEMQRQWAWELLGKQSLQGDENILDFGCGDGKVSAELSHFVPRGKVTAVDISSEMIAFANIKFPPYAYPHLEFKRSHSFVFDDLPEEEVYDIICSFCVFHLVAQPLEILKNFKNHLKPTGKLVLVIPGGRNPEFFQAANEMFDKYQLEAPWKNQTSNIPTMRNIEGCSAFLKEAGYQISTLEMIDTDNPFYDKKEMLDWMVGTVTANWNIPLSISPMFFDDLIERMDEIDPKFRDAQGCFHYKCSRIHVVATP
jgi:trans-aconitate 2-methyltransferase